MHEMRTENINYNRCIHWMVGESSNIAGSNEAVSRHRTPAIPCNFLKEKCWVFPNLAFLNWYSYVPYHILWGIRIGILWAMRTEFCGNLVDRL
jgi:hypothetical protein